MRYFKDKENNIFVYEDNVDSKYIKQDLEEITETQYKSFRLFGVFDKNEDEVSDEELKVKLNYTKDKLKAKAKADRDKSLSELKVYLPIGKDLIPIDADEASQGRILKKLQTLAKASDTVVWIDANNKEQTLTKTQLKNALLEADTKQSELVFEYRKYADSLEDKTLEELECLLNPEECEDI